MKSNNSTLLSLLVAGAIAILCSATVHSQEPEPIGLMLSTVGVVTAEDVDGNVRRLQRRSAVFEGDTLITANRARAQVRFNDRGLVALQPNTSFFIEEHNFDGQEDGSESAVYSLLRGGLQAITGLIGRTNRDRYQVSTPIATIGLRGTHWAATFCTAECDGNAPGLYGGVADGGIDVCNGGGCTAVETNAYFYTPDANTQATTLLAPPSVVFAAVEDTEDEEEGEEAGTVAAAGGTDPNEDEATTPAAEDGEAPETEATADIATFVETAGATEDTVDVSLTLSSVSPDDANDQINAALGLDDTSDLVAENQETVVEEEITAATQTAPAPAGSVVALASARGNPQNADQSAAVEVLIYPTGDSPNSDDFVTPIAGFVDAADPADETQTTTALGALAFDLSQAGCDPCLYATAGLQGTSATLVESIETAVDGVDVFLGRWSGDALLFNSGGGDLSALQDHHYAIALADSGFAFSPALPSSEVPEIAVFSLLEASAPTDAESNTGSLDTFDLYMDLYMQLVTRMDIEIAFDDREITAGLANAFGFAEGAVAGLSAPLTGSCSGDGCGTSSLFGTTSLSFIGQSSEHILGTYALDSREFDQSIFGAYLLGLEETFNPLQVEDLVGTEAIETRSLLSGTQQIGSLFQPFLADLSVLAGNSGNDLVELVNLYDTPNVVAGLNTTSTFFDVVDGELIERGIFNGNNFTAYFGTWRLTDFSYAENGQEVAANETFNYLYTLGAYPQSYEFSEPFVHSYSYAGGPSPVDENGNLGEIGSINLGFDVFHQTVDYFEMELEIAARLYVAEMISVTDLALVVAGSPLSLTGTCSGGDCAAAGELLTGSANLSLFYEGENAYGALGSFGLQTRTVATSAVGLDLEVNEEDFVDGVASTVQVLLPGEHTATGLFVLEGTKETHPDHISQPDGIVTDEGIAAISVTGTDGTNFAPLGTVQGDDTANIGLADLGDRTDLLVSFEDIDEPEEDSGSFTLNEGVLESYEATDSFIADYGVDSSSSEFSVNIGRWALIDADLVVQGDALENTSVGHFAFSDTPTDIDALIANPFDIGAPILSYSLVEATKPSDESDNLGELLSADLEVDLYHQLISAFSLELTIGARMMEASLYEATALGENEIMLLGECSGGDCSTSTDLVGEFSVGFIGAEAEGAIGSYGLVAGDAFPVDDENLVSDISAAGVFVLARDAVDAHPDYVEGSGFALAGSGIAALSTTVVIDGVYAPTGTTEATPLVEIGLGDLGTSTDLVVDFLSVDGDPGEGGNFSVNQALLREYSQTSGFIAANQIADENGVLSTSTDFDVNVGRWELIDSDFVLNGEALDTLPEAHFGFSDTPTNMDNFLSNPFSLEAPIVSYSLVDATAPTDQEGNLGELTSVTLEADLFLQLVSEFNMELSVGDVDYYAWLYAPTYFGDGLEEGGVKLAGYCELGVCGDDEGTDLLGFAGLGLLGAAGEGVLGNYELFANDGVFPDDEELLATEISVNGVFVLARDSVEQNPYWFGPNSANSTALSDTGLVLALHIEEIDDEDPTAEIGLEAGQLGFIVEDENTFSYFDESSALHSFNYSEHHDFEDETEMFALDGGGALLVESGFHIFGDNLVNWGRWFAPKGFDFVGNEGQLPTGTDFHYAWSDGVKTDFSYIPTTPEVAYYDYAGGTSPTDEMGNIGAVNYIELDLDLFMQAITHFEMDFDIAERSYFAQMDPRDSTYFLDNGGAELELIGFCAFAECGEGVGLEGETSLIFVGDTAGAEAFDHIEGVIGSFALEANLDDEFDDEESLKDLLDFNYYPVTEVDLGEGFDFAQISAAGTYFLLGEALDNDLYFDLLATVPPTVTPASSGVAAIVSGVQSMYYPYDVHGSASIIGGVDDEGAPIDDDIFLTSLGSVESIDNLVVGFDSIFTEEDVYGYETDFLEQFRIYEGVLAEHGGFGSFLADNDLLSDGVIDFGINWGRWFAYATYEEGEYDPFSDDFLSTPSDASLGMDHHFVYTDGVSGVSPTFDDPTEARYSYVGGTSPTDEWGRTGVMDADLYLDLYTQTLSNFEMNIRIGERRIYAEYNRDDYNYYGSYQTAHLGMDLEDVFDEGINLRGACVGGLCDEGMDYSYGNGFVLLRGSADLVPFGPNGEGFLGGFELEEDEDEGSYYPDVSVFGTFVLAQDETRPHIGWQVDPAGVDAEVDSVAVMSGSLIPDDTTPTFDPFASVADLAAGDSFTTVTIEDRDNIVDSILESDPGCLACEFEVQDAVVILVGDVSTDYQYIDNPTEVSWATWANQDNPDNDWLFDDMSSALDSSRLLNTIYANNLTSAAELMSATPLTGYIDDDPTEILGHYRYAGGPSPVYYNGAAADPEGVTEFASVNTIDLGVDFLNQTVDYFDADIRIGDPSDYYSYYDIELSLDSSVSLAPVTSFDINGYCNGCGSSSYDEEDFQGHAEIAFVGDRAEQVIGGLAAWSDGNHPYGSGTPNLYAVEAAFVLNQDFDMNWVEASELRVGEPAFAAIAPSFVVDSSLVSLAPLVIVDDLSSEDVQLELTDFVQPYGGQHMDVFSGFSGGGDFLNIGEGYLDNYGRERGGYQYSYSGGDEEPWFIADWGVWDSQSYDFEFAAAHAGATTVDSPVLMPFVTSRDLTLELPDNIVTGGLGTTAQFVFLGGPDPVDILGGEGHLEEILMEFDFATATVVDFYLSAKDQYYHLFEMGLDTANVDPITNTRFQLDLIGTCDTCDSSETSAIGTTVFAFLGDNAEGVGGSFGLLSDNGFTLSGAYVLHQNDHWVDLPDTGPAGSGGVVAFAATDATAVSGTSFGFYVEESNTAELLTVQSFDHTHPNALASFDTVNTCGDDCSWELTQGELRNYDNTNGNYSYLPDAYWGRWETQDDLTVDGNVVGLTDYQHWAYSPDPSSYDDPIWDGTDIYYFNYASGTTPTDNFGNTGYIDDFQMTLDLGTRQITEFEFDVDVGGYDYAMEMAAAATDLDADDPFADIGLTGNVWDGTDTLGAVGNSSVFLIGQDADAAIGTFDVNAIGADHTVNGAFLLDGTFD